MKILYVCTGNICRSTTAEILTREFYPEIEVDSCGLSSSINNNIMAKKMRETVTRMGLEFTPTIAKKATRELIDWADHVIYFQPSHLGKLEKKFGKSEKYKSMYGFIGKTTIPDPNYVSCSKFCDDVRDIINIGIKIMVKRLK